MTVVEPRINFVTLVVADLERARRFYLDGLGWSAALDVGGEVVMVHVGSKLVLSLWAESEARAEIGEVARGGTLPFTLAHNVASAAEVDAALEAGLAREVTFPRGPSATATMTGEAYLTRFAIPNFYFHATTAYDILRENGFQIGKQDFLLGVFDA